MKYIFFFISAGLLVLSCEKVIEIDLNTANANIVVESELFNGEQDFDVKLSFTSSFFKKEEQEFISNAIVSLSEEGGTPVEAVYIDSGLYRINDYLASDDKVYTLSIDHDGVNYSSTAAMPPAVALDSLRHDEVSGPFGGGEGQVVFMHWTDNAEQENFYRVLYALNDTIRRSRSDVFIFDDGFTNGNVAEIPLFVRSFEVGDTVDIQFLSIDPKAYDYLLTLNTIIGNGQPSAAPANPNSNFTNGALGYFAIYNGDNERIIIE